MRTSKTGTWQTVTILGLADTFPMAEWQSQLQVIARNLPEISIKVRFLQALIFWSSFIVLNSLNQNQKPLWGVSLCGSLFKSHSQYAMGRPQPAFLNTSRLSPYIHGIVKNTKTYRKWSLPTGTLQSYWFKQGSPSLQTFFMKAQHSPCCSHAAAHKISLELFKKKKTLTIRQFLMLST